MTLQTAEDDAATEQMSYYGNLTFSLLKLPLSLSVLLSSARISSVIS